MPEDENAPALKKDVWLARRELEIRAEQLSDQVRDLQTELLKSFQLWQEQVKSLEQRLSEIEKRLVLKQPS